MYMEVVVIVYPTSMPILVLIEQTVYKYQCENPIGYIGGPYL